MERTVRILWTAIDTDRVSELKDRYFALMDPERRRRINACRSESKRAELIFGGALIIRAFKEAGLSEVGITYGKNGKPEADREGFYFNLSHSGNTIALAFSDGELGFDIQKPVAARESLKDRILSPGEKERLSKDKTPFNRIWSLKESFSKLTGEGIGTDFTGLEFYKDTESDLYTVTYHGTKSGYAREFVSDEISVAVCMADPFTISEFTQVKL